MTEIAFIDLAAQQRHVRSAIDDAIAGVLDHGKYIMGPEVAKLEEGLASFSGAKHVLTCGSGTDALVLGLMALGLKAGDGVIVPTFTFVATAEAVALLGAIPVFADCESGSFNMGPEALGDAIESARSAGVDVVGVIPVDLFGEPADYQSLSAVAEANGLWVFADAAQSLGAADGDARVGSLAPMTATSFFPAKPLGCYGDGGAVFTDDDEVVDRLRSLRVHGQGSDKYDNVLVGLNGRLDTLQAAILLVKLSIFDDELARREEVAQRYDLALSGLVDLPTRRPGTRSAWAQYTIRTPRRDELQEKLRGSGVPTAVYYVTPLHQQTAYAPYARGRTCPNAEAASTEVLSLPMHPYLDPDDQGRITLAVRDALDGP